MEKQIVRRQKLSFTDIRNLEIVVDELLPSYSASKQTALKSIMKKIKTPLKNCVVTGLSINELKNIIEVVKPNLRHWKRIKDEYVVYIIENIISKCTNALDNKSRRKKDEDLTNKEIELLIDVINQYKDSSKYRDNKGDAITSIAKIMISNKMGVIGFSLAELDFLIYSSVWGQIKEKLKRAYNTIQIHIDKFKFSNIVGKVLLTEETKEAALEYIKRGGICYTRVGYLDKRKISKDEAKELLKKEGLNFQRGWSQLSISDYGELIFENNDMW